MEAFGRTLTGHKIRGLSQIKKFLRQITPQNKLYYFSKKKSFGVKCTLTKWHLDTNTKIDTTDICHPWLKGLNFLPKDDRSNGFTLQFCFGMSRLQEHDTAAKRKSNFRCNIKSNFGGKNKRGPRTDDVHGRKVRKKTKTKTCTFLT